MCSSDLKKFAAKPSYKVLQQDDNAHIVKDLKSNSVSYVIFEGKTKLPSGHIAQTDTACLLMTKDHNDGIILTVANPDLALYRGESDELFCENGKRVERSIYSRPWIQNDCLEVPVVVTLKGKWNIEPTGEYEIISSNKKETQLRVRCREAKSYDIKLTK